MSTITRFKVTRWGGLERCEFVRATDHYYIAANGRRHAKKGSYYEFYTTEPEAQAALERMKRAEAERIALRRVEGLGPELLEALHLALPFVEDHEGSEVYKPGAVARALTTIRATIAKAEGKQA